MTAAAENMKDVADRAESATLGCLLNGADLTEARTFVPNGPDAWGRGAHQAVWAAIVALDDDGQPVDTVTVAQQLARVGRLDEVGGAVALADLAAAAPARSGVREWAVQVAESAQRRSTHRLAHQVLRDVLDPTVDPWTAMERLTANGDGRPASGRVVDRYPDVDWTAVWDDGLDEPDWLIDGFLETRKSAAVFAAAGHGKSLVTQEMAACIATGLPFAGLRTRQADVLYVDAENDLGDVIDRLKSFGFTPDQLGRLHYKSLPNLPALDRSDGGRELLELAQAHGAELVIIDTVARTVAGPEQDADTYRAYARATGQLLKAAGIACWRIDHAGKDTSAGQRGSSAKNDDVDTVWQLDRDANQSWTLKTATATLKKRSRHGMNRLQVSRLDPHGLLSQRLPARTATTPSDEDEVQRIIDLLDDHDVPLDDGRPTVRKLLKDLDEQASNDVLAEALRLRRELSATRDAADSPRTAPRTADSPPQNAVPDSPRTAQDSEPGASRGPLSVPVRGSIGPRTESEPSAPTPQDTCRRCEHNPRMTNPPAAFEGLCVSCTADLSEAAS